MSGRVISSQTTYGEDLAYWMIGDYPNNTWRFRQSFNVPSDITKVSSITLYLKKIGTYSSGTTTVTLNGVSASRSSSGWSTGYAWRTYTFSSPVSVSSGTNYLYFTSYGGSLVGPGGYVGSSGGYYSTDGSTWRQSYTNSDNVTISFKSLVYSVSGFGKPRSMQPTTVTNITYNSATLSSGAYDDNSSPITRSGFVLSNVTSSPVVPDHEIWVSSGMSNFSTTPTTLNFGTTYYVRSYATNLAGTSYGPLTSFVTTNPVAYVTNVPTWTLETPLSLYFSNIANLYLRVVVFVNGEGINTWDVGQVTSVALASSESSMVAGWAYQRMPNTTSGSLSIAVSTFTDSGYTNQVGATQYRTDGTVYINQDINKPIFTTYTVENLDKTITNTDKYGNVLVSSSTSTLLGSNNKMINGYSKLRAIITSANKMVAKNYATAVKYRFVVGGAYSEQPYSADATVNLDIDNATSNVTSITAYDSRNLTTTVNNSTSITNVANYVACSVWGITLKRDNGVDSKTKLAFSGSYWKQYFGGGTSGVLNTATVQWRYKETTATWGSQTWNTITPTDTNGSLSYDAYINGDLGANGFDTNKSYNIEVRIYDKLTNYIIEGTLNVGIPVMDITSSGVAIMGKYDSSKGGALQLYSENVETTWIPVKETWTYVSATSFKISGDKTGKYQKGDKIKLTQTTVKYFYIIGISYSSPNTTITVTGGSDYSLANTTITSPFYSKAESPQGFPLFFNWTTTIICPSGTAPTYQTNSGSFSISGGFCFFTIYLYNSSGGTSGASVNPLFCYKPIPASLTKPLGIFGTFAYYEQDIATISSGVLRGDGGNDLFYFMKYNGANMTGDDQSSVIRYLFAEGKFPI